MDYNRQKDQILKGTGIGVVVVCSVQDSQAPDDSVWVNVTLDIEHVTEFKLIEGNTTNVVISGGLSVMFHEDQIYLCIDWEANTLEEFAKSSFLIVGSRCFWTLSEYTRSVTR